MRHCVVGYTFLPILKHTVVSLSGSSRVYVLKKDDSLIYDVMILNLGVLFLIRLGFVLLNHKHP